jgi:hypothetical protein
MCLKPTAKANRQVMERGGRHAQTRLEAEPNSTKHHRAFKQSKAQPSTRTHTHTRRGLEQHGRSAIVAGTHLPMKRAPIAQSTAPSTTTRPRLESHVNRGRPDHSSSTYSAVAAPSTMPDLVTSCQSRRSSTEEVENSGQAGSGLHKHAMQRPCIW